MLDKIVLGLLQDGPQTAYSLQKLMEQSTGFFYGSSAGALHPALRKLHGAGHIDKHPVLGSGRGKIEYAITPSGRSAFDLWVGEPLHMGRIRDEALVRLFFLGHLPVDRRQELLDAYQVELKNTLQALQLLRQQTEQATREQTLTPVQTYRLETLRFGTDYLGFVATWHQELLERHTQDSS